MAQDIEINISSNLNNLDESIRDVNLSLKGLEKSLVSISDAIAKSSGKDNFSKLNESAGKTNKTLKETTQTIKENESSQGSLFGTVIKTTAAVTASAVAYVNLASTGLQITDALSKVGRSLIHFDGGLFSSIKSVALLGGGLLALGSHINETADSSIGKLTGRLIQLSGIILGGVAYAISTAIVSFGEFAYQIGSKLVDANQAAVYSFSKLEKQTLIFNRTMEAFTSSFGESVGTVDRWTDTINSLSEATGFTRANLKFATTEIVASTSQMGFNEEQMKKLLNVVVDYGTITGDVSQATIDFISALNGNSQSILKYGVHLSDASIQQDLLKKGVNASFSSFSEHEKVTARFSTLLDKYSLIAGKAAAVSGTLSGQSQLLANNQERLAQAYGKGAAIVENVNVLNYALNAGLNLVNENVVAAAGFFGALGARALQVGGIFLAFSFKIAAVITAFKTLNVFLETDFSKTLFAKSIPYIGKSLNDLVSDMGGVGFQITNIKTLFQAVGRGLIKQYELMIAGSLGLEAANLSLGSSFAALSGIIYTQVVGALVAVRTALLSFLSNPIVLAVAGIIAAFLALKFALETLESKTGVFSKTFNVLVQAFSAGASIFQPVIDILGRIKDALLSVGDILLGVVVLAVSKLTLAFLQFLEIISPVLKFFGVDFAKGVHESIVSLRKFNDDLIDVGLQVSKIPDATSRAIASTNEAIGELDLEKLNKLADELKDVGLSQLDLIKRERDERLKTLNDIFPKELRVNKQYSDLKFKIEQDFNAKKTKLEDEAAKEREKKRKEEADRIKKNLEEIQNKIRDSISSPFSAIGKSVAENKPLDQSQQLGVIAGISGSAAGGALQGAAGAGSAITGAVGEVIDAIIPGLGSVIKQLFDLLGSDPSLFRGLIRGFIDGAVTFVENIIQNIPVLITEIINGLPRIIDKIISDLPKIISAFAAGIGEAAVAFALAMPDVAITFATSLIAQAPAIAQALISAIPKAVGGGVKQAGGVFGKLGFAEGGIPSVKSVRSGFPNDTFPASLSSGELIVDRSTTSKLIKFLDSNGSGQPQQANSSSIAAMMAQPIIVNLNGREIARAVRSEVKAGFVL